MERKDEESRYTHTVEMKIKVVLLKLFTQQGVRDELLAKADGVEYISKGGSSLTVITRTKSGSELLTKRSNTNTLVPGFNWNNTINANTNGEMRVDDDDEMLNNQEVGSPDKRSLLEKLPLLSAPF